MDNVEELLAIMPMLIGLVVANFLLNTGRGLQAMMLGEECLIFLKSNELKKNTCFRFTIIINNLMFKAACMSSSHTSAERYAKKLLDMYHTSGDIINEGKVTFTLGKIYQNQNEFEKAKRYYQNAIDVTECTADKQMEAECYCSMGQVSYSRSEYHEAKNYFQKALAITVPNGYRITEAAIYGNLGVVVQSLGEYDKAEKYYKRALKISEEIGYRKGEADAYGNLGLLYHYLSQCQKAKEFTERALAIRKKIGDRKGEATDYGNLGILFQSLCEYQKAKEYTEKALKIRKEIGDREGEAADYGNLGTLFQSLGEYQKAKEYTEEALKIRKEIGDKKGEAADYGNLGTLFQSLGEYQKAKEYTEKALKIRKEIGDKRGEATDYGNLGTLFQSLGEYGEAKEYIDKALKIRKEIGDRRGEAADYGNLGTWFQSLGAYEEAKEHTKRALAIRKEIGDREGEASAYGNLGTVFHSLGEPDKAKKHFSDALSIYKDIGHSMGEFKTLCGLTVLELAQSNFQEAASYLSQSIEKFEKLRHSVKDNDYFKISLLEEHGACPYKILSKLLSISGNHEYSLYIEELRRARALADLMTAQYSAKQAQFSGDPQSLFSIHDVIKREANCTFVYLSVDDEDVRIWVLKTSGGIIFRRIQGKNSDSFGNAGSLDLAIQKKCLRLFHKIIIAPVADFLKGPEIIIVPDSCMYHVPFEALLDEGGRYLSEEFRIRIVPSLTVLKFIQDSPSNYHSSTGALIVGAPEVSKVIYRGEQKILAPLPGARKEAEMIGEMLGVIPLLGKDATKEAVLEQMRSVALIHFAAHGDPERGEIALSPVITTNSTPQEEEYLLTMADVSKVQLRAKLVVLSCCHSGRGEIKVEGVIGIARAFLGSGARSVLVARWALDDESTEQFMKCFYEHLFRGESASESLHEVRKWMRGNSKYSQVKKWATFMLIGDNVKLR